MTRQEYLLTCLAEECNEVAQRVSKALRFGLNEVQHGQPDSNGDRIVNEINDLLSVLDMCFTEGVLRRHSSESTKLDMQAKRVKVEQYFLYARNICGTIIIERPQPPDSKMEVASKAAAP